MLWISLVSNALTTQNPHRTLTLRRPVVANKQREPKPLAGTIVDDVGETRRCMTGSAANYYIGVDRLYMYSTFKQ